MLRYEKGLLTVKSLSERFDEVLVKLSNPELEHPVFYNAPIGIRFEIGKILPDLSDSENTDEHMVSQVYIEAALQRATSIYAALPHAPNILRIDTYTHENEAEHYVGSDLSVILPFPHTQRSKRINDDGVEHTMVQLYWDLNKISFSPEKLLKEIIKADFSGISELSSNVYFTHTGDVYLYHVYDDRGADLVAESKEILRPIYDEFNSWILEYDRKQIEKQFAK